MEKEVVNMSNWSVGLMGGLEYNLSGIADNHPKLGRNVFVCYTSRLEKAYLENDILVYVTRNTEYHCPLKYALLNIKDNEYIDKNYVENEYNISLKEDTDINKVMRCFCEVRLDIVCSDFTKHVIELTKVGLLELEKKENEEKERLIDVVKGYEDSIYLEVSKIQDGDMLSYNVNGKVGVIKPYMHVGMFQDSILYIEDGIDFRYFPKGNSIETYSWSDNIKSVVVKNMKNNDIVFNDNVIKPKEEKIISKEKED